MTRILRQTHVTDWVQVTIEPGQSKHLHFHKALPDDCARPGAFYVDYLVTERLAGELLDEKHVCLRVESYNIGTQIRWCGRPANAADPYRTDHPCRNFIVPVGRLLNIYLEMGEAAKTPVTLRVELQGRKEDR